MIRTLRFISVVVASLLTTSTSSWIFTKNQLTLGIIIITKLKDKKNKIVNFKFVSNLFTIFFRCKGLILLETYTALSGDKLKVILPQFLTIEKEVTGNPDYSMFNLSLREEWNVTNKFCHNLNGKDLIWRTEKAITRLRDGLFLVIMWLILK